jgi:transposase
LLTVDQREEIRRAYFIDGHSIRQIAREGHHDRRTVRKALHDAGPPRYTLRESRARPVLDPFLAVIERWLAEDTKRPPKQRHTARRIYHRLVAECGFSGGESTIRQYVRERRPRTPALFIPLAYAPGADAQCDFGEAQVILQGKPTTVQFLCLCLCLCYSKLPFVIAFPHQRQEAFFEGQRQGFAFFGGVPHAIWYDHLSQAGRPRSKRPSSPSGATTCLRAASVHPGRPMRRGLWRILRLRSGQALVGYARRNFLVPVPEVASLEELNALRCG